MDDTTKIELQSAAFERLIQHLRERKDVQNIGNMYMECLMSNGKRNTKNSYEKKRILH